MRKLGHKMRRLLALASLGLLGTSASAAATDCGQLAKLTIPHVTVTSATVRHAVHMTKRPTQPLPEYCRVLATASLVEGSRIGIEVWIPTTTWNGRLQGVGNGGYSSNISHYAMAGALMQGFAVVATDTGHQGEGPKFAVGHPQSIIDWGYRAVHEMTQFAKLAVRDFKGRSPEHSYFVGCSTGGGQALSEAQRFPADYDGILAGDPGNDRVNLNALFLWAYVVDHSTPGKTLTPAELHLLSAAAVSACDKNDGVTDGIISNPLACHFDPSVLQCKAEDGKNCLSTAQVATAKAIYTGITQQGQVVYPGFEPGSEALKGSIFPGWNTYLTGLAKPMRLDFWKDWVFDDPNWDWRSFDFNRDRVYANRKLADVVSVNPDLRAFARHGSKLILYHGWADPVVPPRQTIDYFNAVVHRMGEAQASQTTRLFMIPGMGHCVGGSGPLPDDQWWPPKGASRAESTHEQARKQPPANPKTSLFGTLMRWTEQGDVQKSVIASQRLSTGTLRTRPICAYPQVATWTGRGSSDNASNFVCRAAQGEAQP